VPQQFASERDLLAAVTARLQAHGGDPAIAAALSGGVVEAETERRAEPVLPGDTALNVRLGGFVIRDDDLPFLDALSAVATAVAASAATAGVASPLIIAALTSVAKLCWNVWRKGTMLNATQVLAIGLLRAHGPLELAKLTDLARQKQPDIDLATMKATLRSLNELELNDGRIVALATVDASDTWRAHAI